ncbi:hypothetical protein IWQ62_002173 [Dispira parvispora]|uniref:Uncharacterized protein n=1 Tax=Dispira parvispora TaxID=1520584 RepID=A0A9W8AUE4_9FUNG|nr:hypothetical protein IWQ62_002173 [Dispira parvispora]
MGEETPQLLQPPPVGCNFTRLPFEILSKVFILSQSPEFCLINRYCYVVANHPKNQTAWLLHRHQGIAQHALRNSLLWGFCNLHLVHDLEHVVDLQRGIDESNGQGYRPPKQILGKRDRNDLTSTPKYLPASKRVRKAESPITEYSDSEDCATTSTNPPKFWTLFYGHCRLSRRFFNYTSTPAPIQRFITAMLRRGVPGDEPMGFPLVKSVQLENIRMTQYLLQYGANPDILDNAAIKLAVRRNDYQLTQLLLNHNAHPSPVALRCAIVSGNSKLAQLLLQYGAVPDMSTVRLLSTI